MDQMGEAIFEGKIQDFHPALDFKGGKAYVSIRLHTKTDKGVSKRCWIIVSDKNHFVLSKEALEERGLFSEILGVQIDGRWSKESVNRWLKSKEDFTLKDIFTELRSLFEFYLDYADKRLYTLIPLWIIGTYFFPLFNGYPIIFLNGSSGSGKSKTGELTAPLCFNGRLMANISDAGLFRTIHVSRGTLVLDENEKISGFGDRCSQINFLLSGYKPGANVLRAKALENGNFEPEEFQVYAPKMIANIRGVKETALLNRSIKLILTPSQNKQAQREVNPQSSKIKTLRDKFYVYLMNHWKEVRQARKAVKEMNLGIYGYDQSNWLPILALAHLLGKNQFDEVFQFAEEKIKENKELSFENDNQHRLFSAVANLLRDEDALKIAGNEHFFSFEQIYQHYLKELGYGDYDSENPMPHWLSKQSVGRMLEHLQIGKENRLLIGGKLMRGRWISSASITQTQERFGYSTPN